MFFFFFFFFFFFNDTATTEIYTLSLHDALPISRLQGGSPVAWSARTGPAARTSRRVFGFIDSYFGPCTRGASAHGRRRDRDPLLPVRRGGAQPPPSRPPGGLPEPGRRRARGGRSTGPGGRPPGPGQLPDRLSRPAPDHGHAAGPGWRAAGPPHGDWHPSRCVPGPGAHRPADQCVRIRGLATARRSVRRALAAAGHRRAAAPAGTTSARHRVAAARWSCWREAATSRW